MSPNEQGIENLVNMEENIIHDSTFLPEFQGFSFKTLKENPTTTRLEDEKFQTSMLLEYENFKLILVAKISLYLDECNNHSLEYFHCQDNFVICLSDDAYAENKVEDYSKIEFCNSQNSLGL